MSNFLLSPGITPELADVFVIAVPLAVGFGYLLAGRRGFELAVSLAAIVLGGIKLYTDYQDLPDVAVALAAILGGALWALRSNGFLPQSRGMRIAGAVVGAAAVLVGVVKLRDFYDPFDLLLADTTILSGAALWLYARRGLPRPSGAD
jgi:peptidoglycan/LPS O-acetylase OafA/YrhL